MAYLLNDRDLMFSGLDAILQLLAPQSPQKEETQGENKDGNHQEVIAALPISCLPAHEYNTEAPQEIVPVEKGAKKRKLKTSQVVDSRVKDFTIEEIFDLKETKRQRVSPCTSKDLIPLGPDPVSLIKRMKGWEVEVRKREDGRLDSYYRNKELDKNCRSFRELKAFVRDIPYVKLARRPKMTEMENNMQRAIVVYQPHMDPSRQTSAVEASPVPIPLMIEDSRHELNHINEWSHSAEHEPRNPLILHDDNLDWSHPFEESLNASAFIGDFDDFKV